MKMQAPENFGGGTFLGFIVSPEDLDSDNCIKAPTTAVAQEMGNHGFVDASAVEDEDKPAPKAKAPVATATKPKLSGKNK